MFQRIFISASNNANKENAQGAGGVLRKKKQYNV